MSSNIHPWPNPTGRPAPAPRPIVRPCDYGLALAVNGLETQLGTIEAYNRLVAAAENLRARIESGDARPQNPMFACSPVGDP